ncbi:MAG: reverse transcriptase domain-containing protein [Oscillospiraceae bacterium]
MIALDFSRAFDTVRHFNLKKCAKLLMHDNIYDWLVNYLEDREHYTKFKGAMSARARINASIVQGSGIGPVAYVIDASDLRPLHQLNDLSKYADDSILLVPSSNSSLVPEEISHISLWAMENNLKLNVQKTKEMIVHKPRTKITNSPPILAGIERVETMNILGVQFQSNLTFRDHVDHLLAQCAQNMYALRTLKSQGLHSFKLWEVAQSVLLGKLTYASQVWWGMLDAESKARLDGALKKVVKQGLLPSPYKSFSEICIGLDKTLLQSILSNPNHVLHRLLPPVKTSVYNMRARPHNREVPSTKDALHSKTFLVRMLYL